MIINMPNLLRKGTKMRGKLIISVFLVTIVLGFLISVQIQGQKKVSLADQINANRMLQMKTVLSNSQAQNTNLKKEHETLLKQLDAARKTVKIDPQLLARQAQLDMVDGVQEVEGSGIQISIDDRNANVLFPLGPDDLSEMINSLKFAGAEAISINDQRIISSSSIVMSGSSIILVNNAPINRTEGIPYELNAIGDANSLFEYFSTLEAAKLKSSGMTVSIVKKEIRIPSYKGTYTFKYAVPKSTS